MAELLLENLTLVPLGSMVTQKETDMSVKSSISLTDQQDSYARSLVEAGQFSSLSSVLQQGLEMLRRRTEAEEVETQALRELINHRLKGPFVSASEMDTRIEDMITRKRSRLRVES